jgi:hypothetical protein
MFVHWRWNGMSAKWYCSAYMLLMLDHKPNCDLLYCCSCACKHCNFLLNMYLIINFWMSLFSLFQKATSFIMSKHSKERKPLLLDYFMEDWVKTPGLFRWLSTVPAQELARRMSNTVVPSSPGATETSIRGGGLEIWKDIYSIITHYQIQKPGKDQQRLDCH